MVIKRQYILYFILLAIFIQFSFLDEYVRGGSDGTTITNYFVTFTICFFILVFNKIPRNKDAFIVIFILFCVYLINFIFAADRNPSWFLYQVIFLSVSYYVAAIYFHIGLSDYGKFSRYVKKIFNVGIPVVICISLYILVKHYNLLIDVLINLFEGQNYFNGYLWQLYLDFYWDKNRAGGTMAIIFCHILTVPEPKYKSRNIFFILTVLPIISAIRHLQLGFALTAIFINIRKMRFIILIILVFLVSIFPFRNVYFQILETSTKKDVRMMGLANTINIVTEYPFGVGNGVYHTFVLNNMDELTEHLSDYGIHMPVGPESDVVYVFSSFGLLCGLIIYAVLVVMLFRLWRLYPSLTYPDKLFALVFIYFFFAGIGEDWIFSFSYWLLFGFALGVITANRNRNLRSQTILRPQNINMKYL